ncbi:hypothetical protein diail_3771 [Diaporthe ilicicola]|nr:hypothetical protein diail_3771 [Diaporthe ilicicola]
MPLILCVFTCGLWLAGSSIASSLNFGYNATLFRRDSINKYGGCDKMYDDPNVSENVQVSGKSLVDIAYHDALRLAQLINPFLVIPMPDGEDPIEQDPGTLEIRYLGDINEAARRNLIGDVFRNTANWYPWFFWDLFGNKIEVYCEVDQPNDSNYQCDKLEDGNYIGAYAINTRGKSKIVLCKPFFRHRSLDRKKQDLEDLPSHNRDITYMENSGQTFFHEMTHLSAVEGRSPRVITDLKSNPIDQVGSRAYGAYSAELLARRFPAWAYLNGKYLYFKSDNYAWYATARWFSQFYGTPEPAATQTSEENGDVGAQWVDGHSTDSTDTGDDDDWVEPDYDEISALEAIAFDAGEYTPEGWLRGKNLRILPLGDSITYGYLSSDGNGYRNTLKTLLTSAGNTVDMVGSVRSGDMADNDNEGHSGFTISEIAARNSAYRQRPNVVLLHAGTNDMGQTSGWDTAPERLDSLVEALIGALPDATIVVARIVPAASSATMSRIRVYNNAITKLMSARFRDGQHVMMVDMPSGVRTSDLGDGLHPSDQGYEKMAIKWAIALTAADSLGWIKAPVDGEGPVRDTCPRDPTWLPQGEIANGAGLGANLFVKSACFTNPLTETCGCRELDTPSALTQDLLDSTDECERRALNTTLDTAVHFADLNGDGRAEYLWVANNGAVTAFLNLGSNSGGADAGKVQWAAQGVIASGVGGDRASVRFADLNGDGRAEYLRVNDDGSVECWLNAGGQDGGINAAKITWIPQGKVASGIGKDGAGVRFADLNGDGRAEYLYINTDGSVEAYLNLGSSSGGADAGKVAWSSQGMIASGVGMGRDSIIFTDINGDGRADYVALSRTDGSARLWLNGGGPDNGPNAAKVVWLPHGTIANGVGGSGMGIQFADLNGDSRAEYLDVKFDTSAAYKAALIRMRESYEGADQVLVLDSYLLSAEGPMSDNELLLRIYCAPWSRRLWTLQEGYLPPTLVFRLADRYLPSRYFVQKRAFYGMKLVQGGAATREDEFIQPLPTHAYTYILGLRERECEQFTVHSSPAAMKETICMFPHHVTRLLSLDHIHYYRLVVFILQFYVAVWTAAYSPETVKAVALNDAKSALTYRATSMAEDEPLCLGNLLGVDPSAVVDVDTREERMRVIWDDVFREPRSRAHGALVFARGRETAHPRFYGGVPPFIEKAHQVGGNNGAGPSGLLVSLPSVVLYAWRIKQGNKFVFRTSHQNGYVVTWDDNRAEGVDQGDDLVSSGGLFAILTIAPLEKNGTWVYYPGLPGTGSWIADVVA